MVVPLWSFAAFFVFDAGTAVPTFWQYSSKKISLLLNHTRTITYKTIKTNKNKQNKSI